jgi:integrase
MKVYRRGSRWWFDGVIDGERKRFPLEPNIITREKAEECAAKFMENENALMLRSFIKAYLHESQIRLSENSLARYKSSLMHFESYFGVHRKINTITSRDISAWAVSRKAEGVSPETVNLDLRHVKAALNKAVAWELMDKAPRIEMVKVPRRLPKHLTVDQFKAILLHEPDERFRRLWTFMIWTGVRRAEAAGLKWEDVSFSDKPQVSVIGKGDRQRVVPLLPPALEALGEPKSSGLVFPLGSLYYLSHKFRKAARAANVKAHLHMLRHTACSWMVGQGAPVALVRDIAGHSDVKTTMGYAKAFTGAAYDTLAGLFGFK